MAIETNKLKIALMKPTDQFASDSFNNIIEDIDNKVVGIAHVDSTAHWSVWVKDTQYSMGDVVRTSVMKSSQYLQCKTGGKSGLTEPTDNSTGATITDGTCVWTICSISPVQAMKHNELLGRNVADAHDISAITNLQSVLDSKMDADTYLDSGIITYPTVTDNNDGTLTLVGGKYNFYSDGEATMPLADYAGVTQTVALVDGSNNYICAKLNSGVIVYFLATRAEINYHNVIPVVSGFRYGNTISKLQWGKTATGLASRLLKKWNRTQRFSREDGLLLSEVAGRVVSIGAGTVWFSINELSLEQVTSSANTCLQFCHSSGTWTSMVVTTYNNTQYDDGNNISTLGNNKYGVNWIFRDIGADKIYIVLGQGSYSLAEAQASLVPSLPPLLQTQAMLVGRIIVAKSATTATYVQSAFDVAFNSGVARNASDISIVDVGLYFNSNDVEGALQELGSRSFGIKEWESTTAYVLNQAITYDNKVYRCKTAHTSGTTFSVTNWQELTIGYTADWQANRYYSQNELVVQNGKLKRCITAHTSDSTFSPTEETKWEELGGSGGSGLVTEFAVSTSYEQGQLVVYNNKLYRAIAKFTSGSSFVSSDWQELTGGYVYEWSVGVAYNLGQLITYNNRLYKCIVAHTSATFVPSNWKELTIGFIDNWQANRLYVVNEVVIAGINIVRCNTQHTSGATYDSAESLNWTTIASRGAVVSSWKPNTYYGQDEAVVYNDVIYLASVSHTSGSTFSGDMQVGTEKWRTINTSSTVGDWKQVTQLGATVNQLVEIVINNTLTFVMPPVEILKFTAGAQDQIITEFSFSSGDGSKFTVDGVDGSSNLYVIFDGTVRLKTSYRYQLVKKTTWTGTGQYSEDTNIDDTVFKKIESVAI